MKNLFTARTIIAIIIGFSIAVTVTAFINIHELETNKIEAIELKMLQAELITQHAESVTKREANRTGINVSRDDMVNYIISQDPELTPGEIDEIRNKSKKVPIIEIRSHYLYFKAKAIISGTEIHELYIMWIKVGFGQINPIIKERLMEKLLEKESDLKAVAKIFREILKFNNDYILAEMKLGHVETLLAYLDENVSKMYMKEKMKEYLRKNNK